MLRQYQDREQNKARKEKRIAREEAAVVNKVARENLTEKVTFE